LNESEFSIAVDPLTIKNITLKFNVRYLSYGNISLEIRSDEYLVKKELSIFWNYKIIKASITPIEATVKVNHQAKVVLSLFNPYDMPCELYINTSSLGFGIRVTGPNRVIASPKNSTFEYIFISEIPGHAIVNINLFADKKLRNLITTVKFSLNITESPIEKVVLELFGYKIDLSQARLVIKLTVGTVPFIVRISKKARTKLKLKHAIVLSILLFAAVTYYYVYFRDTLDTVIEIVSILVDLFM